MNAERQVATVVDERPDVVVRTDAASLMEVISRAASDPSTDVDKLERLMGLYERITDKTAKADYSAELAEMQPKLPVVAERGTGDKNKKYALWEDINDAIRPVLAEHGFALSFRVGTAAAGMTVTGILSHRGGHQEETTMTLPLDNSGSKNAVQAVGSSTSYGKRYTAMALLNITSRGEDDDGRGAGIGDTLSLDQIGEVQALMDDVGADRDRFLNYIRVPSIAQIPAKRFAEVIAKLEAKRGR